MADAIAHIPVVKRYRAYLRLEKSLSENTIEAYMRDLGLLFDFFDFELRKFEEEKNNNKKGCSCYRNSCRHQL